MQAVIAVCEGEKAKSPLRRAGFSLKYIAGDHLISHTLTRAVPSAQRVLTSVFGMGTGGTLAVWSPANLRRLQLRLRQNFGGAWRAVSPAAKSRQRMVYPGQESANWRHPA